MWAGKDALLLWETAYPFFGVLQKGFYAGYAFGGGAGALDMATFSLRQSFNDFGNDGLGFEMVLAGFAAVVVPGHIYVGHLCGAMAVALLSVIGQLQDLRQLTLGMVNVQEGGGTVGQAYQMLTEACKLLGLCFVEWGVV